ncbi:hypothetical protein NQ317_005544 [Molorchus minor]|uniref:BTB domain-containing protein n=1 Tax=Molorchus minor TaxID=1323400 RepID=A0ABQ9JXG4_9CUCU|nr:hypothetical protein NQ317_005544 [Molorchus minor]
MLHTCETQHTLAVNSQIDGVMTKKAPLKNFILVNKPFSEWPTSLFRPCCTMQAQKKLRIGPLLNRFDEHRIPVRKENRKYFMMKVGKSVRLYADKYLDNIGSMFGTLYRDELLTDCILHCKDGAAKAHKLILAASSPYFRKIFLEHEEKQTAFIMYGVSVGPLKELLELIYKGSIDIPGDSLNSVFDLAEELQVKGILADDGSTDYASMGLELAQNTAALRPIVFPCLPVLISWFRIVLTVLCL